MLPPFAWWIIWPLAWLGIAAILWRRPRGRRTDIFEPFTSTAPDGGAAPVGVAGVES